MQRNTPDVLTYGEGETIYEQGEVGNVMYVVRSGQVKITRADPRGEIVFAVIGPGEFFGEMSLLSGGKRSTTVRADSKVELDVITRSAFTAHVRDPLALRVMQGLSDRLSRVDQLLEYLHMEQYRIRQDAHDRIYNRLAALSHLIEAAGYQQGAVPEIEVDGDDSIDLSVIAADIRATVKDLQGILSDRLSADKSSNLSRDEVVTQLEGVCTSQSDIWKLDAQLTCDPSLPDIPRSVCWDLECIVEEAITNAAKHGEAEHVAVTVCVEQSSVAGPEVVVKVTDDGHGMHRVPDLSDLPEHSKGLRGMHTRTEALGGRLDLESSPQGAIVTARVPIGGS